ncbi:MAG: hypothetical protein ABSB59_22990 [Streptosporangiaceae bacterium]|jgi:hypothetical protein
MTDMMIRDIPDEVIVGLDAHAGRLGLSRSEYVRRRLAQDAARCGSPPPACSARCGPEFRPDCDSLRTRFRGNGL